jgi:hypothetical protein
MLDITVPLSITTGSQSREGTGCAMNLVSWTNGDVRITDYPSCSDQVLASMVQDINDSICQCVMERDQRLDLPVRHGARALAMRLRRRR